jgi:integrase/recombinase XerC
MRKGLPQPVFRQLLRAIDLASPFGPRDFFMLVFMLHTGLRIGEFCSLRVKDVADQGAPRTWLHVSQEVAKFGKPRWISLNAVAQKAVFKTLAFNQKRGFSVSPEAPLWVNKYHRPLGPRAVEYLVAALRERACLPASTVPHSIRHTFAVQIMERTGNLKQVQDLLGHESLSTVECYATLSPSELEKATNAIARKAPDASAKTA